MAWTRRWKRSLVALAGATAALISILIANTLRQGEPARAPLPPDDGADAAIDARRVAAHLSQAIRIRSVSHTDAALDDGLAFDAMRRFVLLGYPKTFAALAPEPMAGGSLLMTWQGSDPSLPAALLAAHMDVVPVEPGTEGAWTHPPFDGVVDEGAGGFVWGRGALDDKGSLVAILEATESLLERGVSPARTFYFAFGADEEVGGFRGARKIAAALAGRGIHTGFVLDEGMVIADKLIPGVNAPAALIGIAEKGYLSLELKVEMEGGHSSMPAADSAVSVLAAALDRLGRHPARARLDGPARMMLETLAPRMEFGPRVAMSNLWLLAPLVRRIMARSPSSNALVRTTMAPTILEAGVKENVIPAQARAVVNFRIVPGESTAGVTERVRQVIADPRVTLARLEPMFSDPSPVSSTTAPGFLLIARTIRQGFPEAAVAPGLVLGGTDSRHYAAITDDTYRFVPIAVGPGDLKRVHGTDERIGVAALGEMVRFYCRLLRAR